MNKYKILIRYVLSLIILIVPINVASQDYVWIIGGGSYLNNSQSQIELNVKWARQVIKNQNPSTKIRIFYTDGDNPAPDIVNFKNNYTENDLFLPFDYIFGGTEIHAREYYNHSVENISGSNEAKIIKPILEKDFGKLTPDDKVLILYNGHGGYSSSDHSNNHLLLWNKSKLTVYDFEKLLSNINPTTPTRFVMTQCFSGAFGNAIHPGAKSNTLELEGNRCGFMAESARRESEGCSASINIGDYRDYTTFFFAALDGKTRLNTGLASNPDRDNNKIISLREAHLYTLENAYSTDLSRSTSEQYLEIWEPWYLRWLSASRESKNSVYYEIATKVAYINAIHKDRFSSPSTLRTERMSLETRFKSLSRQISSIEARIKTLQKDVIKSFSKDFPNAKVDYEKRFSEYKTLKVEQLQKAIETHPSFITIKQLFDEKAKLVLPLLDAERKLTQIEKVSRMLKLAKLDSYFITFSDDTTRTNYDSILACEKTTL